MRKRERKRKREKIFNRALQNWYQNPGTSGFYPDYSTTFVVKRTRKRDRNWPRRARRAEKQFSSLQRFAHFFLFFFFIVFSFCPRTLILGGGHSRDDIQGRSSGKSYRRVRWCDDWSISEARWMLVVHSCICARPSNIGLRLGSMVTI